MSQCQHFTYVMALMELNIDILLFCIFGREKYTIPRSIQARNKEHDSNSSIFFTFEEQCGVSTTHLAETGNQLLKPTSIKEA